MHTFPRSLAKAHGAVSRQCQGSIVATSGCLLFETAAQSTARSEDAQNETYSVTRGDLSAALLPSLRLRCPRCPHCPRLSAPTRCAAERDRWQAVNASLCSARSQTTVSLHVTASHGRVSSRREHLRTSALRSAAEKRSALRP